MMKRFVLLLLLGYALSAFSAEAVKASHLTQWVRPDGRVQISWITETPQPAAKVIVTDTAGKPEIVPELTDKVRNHAVVLPANAATAVVSATDKTDDALFPALAIAPPPKVATKEFKIPLLVNDPAAPRKNYPVRSGVPFAKDVLGSADEVMLTDDKGNEIEASFEIFSKYPDGSVKWLTVSFNADTKAGETLKLFLQNRKPGSKNAVADGKIAELQKIVSNLFCEITFADGKKGVAKLKENRIVAQTAIPGGKRIEYYGAFNGKNAYVLKALVTLTQNGLISVDFRIIAFRAKKVEEVKSIVWRGFPKCGGGDFVRRQLYADKPHQDGFFQCKNYAVSIPDFWQQWPKGIAVKDGKFCYEMLPELPAENYLPEKLTSQQVFCRYFWYRDGSLYAFRHNMSLPGAFSIYMGGGKPEKLKAQLEKPLFAVSTPEYYCSTGVFGSVYPADGKFFPEAEKCFAESFRNHRKTQEMISDYGWMSWGDWFGERLDNWGDNEYDIAYTTIIQFARTGNLEYLKRGIEMARHYTSVDIVHTDTPKRMPELVHAHSVGHTGKLLDLKSKLGSHAKLTNGKNYAYHDNNGGHDFLTGSFYAAALTGDKLMLDSILRACEQQAVYMSVKIKISIERGPGWYLVNQTNAYLFTSNPLHLNASRLIVDAVIAQQNPKTGCLDLPTDQKECNCPDKKQHRGGKAFAMGVLMHGMRFYHGITGEERAATSIVRSADWLMNASYDPITRKFRYKTGCPQRKYGSRFWTITTEGIAYAGLLTGDRKYAEFLRDHLAPEIRIHKAGASKTFSMEWRLIPHTLYYLKEQGVTELVRFKPDVNAVPNPIGKQGAFVHSAIKIASQEGGKVFVRLDRDTLSGGKCFSGWGKQHGVTWKFPALKAGKYHFGCCYACGAPVDCKVWINGKELGVFSFASTCGLGENQTDWQPVLWCDKVKKPIVIELDGNPVEVKMYKELSYPLNLDFLWFQQIQ